MSRHAKYVQEGDAMTFTLSPTPVVLYGSVIELAFQTNTNQSVI